MGFRLILAGLIFFFNPCINIVDFLPDGIGCILIAAGLSRLADVGDRFYDARKYARVMIAVYAAKLAFSLYIPARWSDGLLPMTFIFSVLEILFFILFYDLSYNWIFKSNQDYKIQYCTNTYLHYYCCPMIMQINFKNYKIHYY